MVGLSCSLPDLPDHRSYHTQDGGLTCGGDDFDSPSCLQWNSGKWLTSHTLTERRDYHCSWTPEGNIGTFLMGGGSHGRTTELAKPDGSVESGFSLKYDTE